MTDEKLEKMQFCLQQLQSILAGLGGKDEDLYLIAGAARAMALAPKHPLSKLDRVQKINHEAGAVEFILDGLLQENGPSN